MGWSGDCLFSQLRSPSVSSRENTIRGAVGSPEVPVEFSWKLLRSMLHQAYSFLFNLSGPSISYTPFLVNEVP